MFKNILVAIDRSAANKEVFDYALKLARASKAKLILLHVLSGSEEGSPIMSHYSTVYPTIGDHYMHLSPRVSHMANELYRRQWKAFETEGMDLLRSFAKEAIAVGVTTEFTQITGYPSSTICEFAQSCDAGVIVIGRRGLSGLQEMLLGSVSNYVVHHAPCSVLLVHTLETQEQNSPSESRESIAR